MRRPTFFLFLLLLLFPAAIHAAPAKLCGYEIPIDIYVNDTRLAATGFLEEAGTVYVPVRSLGEALCAEVVWQEETRCAVVSRPGASLCCYADNPNQSTVPALLKNNAFYVPLRAVAETFGATVLWDSATLAAYIDAPFASVPASVISPFNAYDVKILSALVSLESRDDPIDGKIGVAAVVLNRMRSTTFPNTVHEVIYDTRYSTQFPPAFRYDLLSVNYDLDCLVATRLAMQGVTTVGNALYFSMASATNAWAARNRPYVTTHGTTAFFN